MDNQRAFEVLLPGDNTGGIVAATTASKARYIGFLAAQDANYDLSIIRFRVRRARRFDQWAVQETRRGCFTQDYVQDKIKQIASNKTTV